MSATKNILRTAATLGTLLALALVAFAPPAHAADLVTVRSVTVTDSLVIIEARNGTDEPKSEIVEVRVFVADSLVSIWIPVTLAPGESSTFAASLPILNEGAPRVGVIADSPLPF